MAIDVHGFNIPETPYRPSDLPNELYRRQLEQQRYDYRLQKQNEEDEWRKIGLIQDMTDLSKHQTGSDVANAIGNQKADEVFKKYTAAASTMSPSELAFNIQKDMSGLVTNLEGVKNELGMVDKQAAALKQLYPDLDAASLIRDYRADVINRHIKSGLEFNNPMEIQPTQLDLSNLEFLSKYVTGDKSLREYFSSPKGLDKTTVFKGNPDRYTKFEASVPSWRKLNFDPEKAKGGFISIEPSLDFKTQTLPSDALPSSKGKPFEMMDEQVYGGITGKEKMELIRATKQKFGDQYDKFNEKEKEYAQRNVLLEYAKTFDQSNFHPTDVHTPSASLLKFYAGGNSGGGKSGGGSSSGELNINDVYKQIDEWASSVTPGHGAALNQLPSNAQGVVLKFARDLTGNNQLGQGDVYVKKEDGGKLVIKGIKEDVQDRNNLKQSDVYTIGELDYTGTNLKQQPSVKEKRAVIEKGVQQKTTSDDSYSRSELKKAGWSDAQIETARKAGKIKVHD